MPSSWKLALPSPSPTTALLRVHSALAAASTQALLLRRGSLGSEPLTLHDPPTPRTSQMAFTPISSPDLAPSKSRGGPVPISSPPPLLHLPSPPPLSTPKMASQRLVHGPKPMSDQLGLCPPLLSCRLHGTVPRSWSAHLSSASPNPDGALTTSPMTGEAIVCSHSWEGSAHLPATPQTFGALGPVPFLTQGISSWTTTPLIHICPRTPHWCPGLHSLSLQPRLKGSYIISTFTTIIEPLLCQALRALPVFPFLHLFPTTSI